MAEGVSWAHARVGKERMTHKETNATPPAFRDMLLAIARGVAQ